MSEEAGITPDSWRRILHECGGLVLAVTSTSMKPTLLPGDKVHVVATTMADLESGDVAVYDRSGELICHRLLRGGNFRGDNCLDNDPPVEPSSVVGKVVRIERNGATVDDQAWRRMGNRLRFLLHACVLDRLRSTEGGTS